MSDIERDLVHKIILISITSVVTMAIVAIMAITCSYMQTSNLVASIYDYDYSPIMTQTNEIEVN